MEEAPENCPGPESETAGKADSCIGCPNKGLCSSGQAAIDKKRSVEEAKDIASILKCCSNILIVISGKGGVGKSTIAANLARGFAHLKEYNVGVLDLDICGPSLPAIIGADGEIHQTGSGYSPIVNDECIEVMSSKFFLNSAEDAIIWRGPKKNELVKKMLAGTDWGHLDLLIIDTPPGTSDEHISLSQYLKFVENVWAVLVTTPQNEIMLFPNKADDKMYENFRVFKFPFDKQVTACGDSGVNLFNSEVFLKSESFVEYKSIVTFLSDYFFKNVTVLN